MKRKEFILLTAKATAAIVLLPPLLSACTGNYETNEILGKPFKQLKDFYSEYTGDIACYSTTHFKAVVSGIKLFVFCKAGKVIGFSIKMERDAHPKDLNIPHSAQMVFDNPFGSQTVWQEAGIYKSFCRAKPYKMMTNYSFYSEYLREAEAMVW